MSLVYLLLPLETVFVKTGKIQGRCDSKLSDRATLALADLKQHLCALNLAAAYISPQERAILTANLCGLEIKGERQGLMDWDFGVFEAQRNFLLPKLADDDFGDFFSSYGYQGETANEVLMRLTETIEDIASYSQAENLLCISGEHAVYNFYLRHTPANLRTLHKSDFTPASLHVFNLEKSKFTYVESYFPKLDRKEPTSLAKESEYVEW